MKRDYTNKDIRSRVTPELQLVPYSSPCALPLQHIAILRTCRQIYRETIPALYANIVFRYSFKHLDKSLYWIHQIRLFPEQGLQMIEHFRITFEAPGRIAEIIAYFADKISVLKRLALEF